MLRSVLNWLVWIVLPLGVLLALGSDLTARLADTRYPAATGVVGELRAGHNVGQTFIAQHDGLEAVDLLLATYARRNTGDLILHLRRSPTTADLATVRLPAATVRDNSWQRFAFPPLAGSRGQSYYVELEHSGAGPGNTLTAYWMPQNDPYPYGQATLDRAPHAGDLAFGLAYRPDPRVLIPDALATLGGQIPAQLRLVLGAAVLAAVLLLAGLVIGTARGWWGGSLRRRALLAGLLAGFALAHGTVWLATIPPWQGPDEFAHYAYSALLAQGISPSATDAAAQAARGRIEAAVLASMDARGFTRTVDWYAAPGGPAAGFVAPYADFSTLFIETRQPPLYYRLGALVLRAYSPDPAGLPADLGLYLVRAVSVGLSALVALLAWGMAVVLAPGPRFRLLWVALPLTVALLPMRVFIDSMANNDVLAESLVSALALTLCAWLVRGGGQPVRTLGLAALGAFLAGAGLLAKTSTTVAAAPALWIGTLLAAGLRGLRRRWGRRAALAGGLLILLAGLGAGAAVLLASLDATSATLAWLGDDGRFARHSLRPDARQGPYVLDLPAGRTVEQRISLPAPHPAYRLTFQVWARAAPAAPPGSLWLILDNLQGPISRTQALLPAPDDLRAWQPISVTAVISTEAASLRYALLSTVPAEAGDSAVAVTRLPAEGGAAVPEIADLLRNPAFTASAVSVRPGSILDRLLLPLAGEVPPETLVEVLLNPQRFDKGAVAGSFLGNQYRSYWGWFGWLGVAQQIPPWQLALWTFLVVAALAGWAVGWPARARPPPAGYALAVVTLGALGVAVGTGLARLMAQWAVYDLQAFPQGRYLFVFIVPTTWMLLTGLDAWLQRAARYVPRPGAAVLRRGAAWIGLWTLLYLDLYALLVLLIPYYYGWF